MRLSKHIVLAGICCFIHAIFPFLFQTSATDLFKWCLTCDEPKHKCHCK